MTSSLSFPLLILSLLFTVTLIPVVLAGGSLILEDGYTVTTIIDGNKQKIHPYSILPQFGSSDFIVLDNYYSTFYTLSFPSPQESVIKKLAGNGAAGYVDGELGSAMFHTPKNFAVDYKGNIYVADQSNHVIRKISKSSVSTIAGVNSQKTGKIDGFAQNATFSNDFALTFNPERCALLISDRGNVLIRQINLKAEDCSHSSHSGVGGMSTAWAMGLGLSCLLLGSIVGFVSRPYVISRGGTRLLPCKGTWKHCLTSLVRRVLMFCFDIRSAVVSWPLFMLLKRLTLLSLSNLSHMFRIRAAEFKPPCNRQSVLHFDNSKSSKRLNPSQLKDLISFDDGIESLDPNLNVQAKDGREENTDVSVANSSSSKIEKLLQANVTGFSEQASARRASTVVSLEGNVGLVKRK